MTDDFDSAFRLALQNATAELGAASSEHYVDGVREAVDRAWGLLHDVAQTYGANPDHSLKGFMAEAHHVGTFNIDAARKDLPDVRAELPRSTLAGSPDAVVVGEGGVHHTFQFKYYRTAADTAKELSRPQYTGEGKVCPSDQLDDVRAAAQERAHRLADHRPDQAANLADTGSNVADRMTEGGVESRPLGHDEALKMAHAAKADQLSATARGYATESVVQWTDVARESGEAALSAAAVSAAVNAAPHVFAAIRSLVESGQIPRDELQQILSSGGKGAAQGAIRGAVAAGVVGACRAGLLGEAAKSVDPSGVGATVAVVLSSAGDAVRLATGEISGAEFAERTARKAVVATGGVVGAHIGQAVIPIPVLGAVVGNFLGGLIGAVGYEGGKAAIETLENREGWQAQIALGEAIFRLAVATRVTAERLSTVAEVQESEMRSLAQAGERWARQAEDHRARQKRVSESRDAIRKRIERQRGRVDSLRRRLDPANK